MTVTFDIYPQKMRVKPGKVLEGAWKSVFACSGVLPMKTKEVPESKAASSF